MFTFFFQNGITRSFKGKLAQLQCTDTKNVFLLCIIKVMITQSVGKVLTQSSKVLLQFSFHLKLI